MAITRRAFMKNGALALVGTAAIPAFLQRTVLAEVTTAAANKKRLVVLFQRGAADGLNIVVPYRDPFSTIPPVVTCSIGCSFLSF